MIDRKILFSPFTHRNIRLPNRIVMAPMTRSFCPGHVPNDRVVEYYRRRAAHGVGLIITEGTCIDHPAANGHVDVPFIYGDAALAGWKKVVDAVHDEGGKIIPQLWHVGAMRMVGSEPNPAVPGYSPSGLLSAGQEQGHAMSRDDINDVIKAFALAAKNARDIGFDGVEIHGAHGYLLDQFFWEDTNRREDEYGGSLKNRTRFATEIVKAIRCEVGPGFLTTLRWSQWKLQSYTARLVESPRELEQFLEPLVNAGVDIFHCSTHRFSEPEFKGSDLNLAGWTRKIAGLPTITVGGVGLDQTLSNEIHDGSSRVVRNNLNNLLARLEKEEFDLVAVGRALIADPEWPEKIRKGHNTELKPYIRESLVTLE